MHSPGWRMHENLILHTLYNTADQLTNLIKLCAAVLICNRDIDVGLVPIS